MARVVIVERQRSPEPLAYVYAAGGGSRILETM